jgi:transcriptional regulator with XRE-family HTH domain
MDEINTNDLKSWREKLGIAQTRMAELANISLSTIRQLEGGTNKPHKKTLTKLFEIIKGIEGGVITVENPTGARRGRKPGNVKAHVDAGVALESEIKTTARRGRPRKNSVPEIGAPVKPELKPVFSSEVKPSTIAPIQLSNLDLELINRIVNMSNRQKLALLDKFL